jgi:hypothetical protein
MLMQFVALSLSRLEEDWQIRLIKMWEILAQEGWLAIMCALVPPKIKPAFPKTPYMSSMLFTSRDAANAAP